MKKLKLSICLLCVISFARAQNLDEIVNKHIEAIGGKENWEKIKSMRVFSTMKAQGADIKFTTVQIDKKAMRQDISVMGMTGYSIIQNTEGWYYYPWQGHTKAEAMTPDDLKNSQDDLNILDEFLIYKELGRTMEYYGMDDIDGTECHKIKMTGKNDKEVTFYIDPDTYMIIKRTEKVRSNGKETENSVFFSDYKKINEGIVLAMSTAGGWGESETTKLEINPAIDESLFKVSK